MNTAEHLTQALLTLGSSGRRPRCSDPEAHAYWLSDRADERAMAADWCHGCPILTACHKAAEQAGERFGVWAGIDRTGLTPAMQRAMGGRA